MENDEMIDSFLAVYPASGKFQVQLFPTSVRMFGKIQTGKFDSQVLLEDLHPCPDRYWAPNQFYRRVYQALTVLGVCVVVSFWIDPIPKAYSWIGFAVLVSAIAFLLRRPATIEHFYFRFKSKPTEHAFAIGRYGPDGDRLDEFVALLIEQIKKVQSAELFDTDDPASPE